MMRDDMNAQNGPGREESARGRAEPTSPSGEREVPMSRRPTPSAVQAWLDGDLPEAAVRRGETAKDFEFWNRVNEETDARRRMKTPAYVYDNIMSALPQSTPTVITPWWRRPFAMTPAMAAAVAAGILAVGAAVTAVVMFAR
jgi:hypothetical protein